MRWHSLWDADDAERGKLSLGGPHPKIFDTLDHAHLRAFLQQRVGDGVVLRLIGKWLNAGVMEDGAVTHRKPEARKAVWSRPYSPMCTCTTCWTSGSRGTCNLA